MVVAFFLSTAGLLSSVKTEVLFNSIAEGEQTYLPYLLTALPVCLVSLVSMEMYRVSSNITIVMVAA